MFGILTVGYVVLNRTFSYLGIPAIKLFLGEAVLVLSLVSKGRESLRLFKAYLKSSRFFFLRRSFALFMVYGVFQLIVSMAMNHPVFDILRDSAFFYYGLYFLVGVLVASRVVDHMTTIRKVAAFLAAINGLYGIAYIFFLGRLSDVTIPGTPEVAVFAQPSGSPFALLLLLSLFERNVKTITLIALNLVVLLGIQVRAEWLGFLVGLMTLAVLRGNLLIVLRPVGLLLAILLFALLFDVSLPAPLSRGGEISVRGVVSRALAPIDAEAAGEYSEYAAQHEGTFLWRVVWWGAILEQSSQSLGQFLIGNGLGYDLAGLVGYGEASGLGGLRTPHSVIAYCIGYLGIIGLVVFLNLQFSFVSCFRSYLRSTNVTCQTIGRLGIILIATWFSIGCFTSVFEAPYGAIPYYLTMGFLLYAPASMNRLPTTEIIEISKES